MITDANTRVGVEGAGVVARDGVNVAKATTTARTGAYVLAGLLADTFRLRASAKDYQERDQTIVTVGTSFMVSSSFTVTRTGPSTCSWAATTTDSWIEVSPTSGSDSATVSLFMSANDSAEVRTGTVLLTWEGGNGTHHLAAIPCVTLQIRASSSVRPPSVH